MKKFNIFISFVFLFAFAVPSFAQAKSTANKTSSAPAAGKNAQTGKNATNDKKTQQSKGVNNGKTGNSSKSTNNGKNNNTKKDDSKSSSQKKGPNLDYINPATNSTDAAVFDMLQRLFGQTSENPADTNSLRNNIQREIFRQQLEIFQS